MGIRNTPEQQREYNRAARERDRKAGYRLRQVKVHEEDWPEIRSLVELRRSQRERRERPST